MSQLARAGFVLEEGKSFHLHELVELHCMLRATTMEKLPRTPTKDRQQSACSSAVWGFVCSSKWSKRCQVGRIPLPLCIVSRTLPWKESAGLDQLSLHGQRRWRAKGREGSLGQEGPAKLSFPPFQKGPCLLLSLQILVGKIEAQAADILKHCLSNLCCPLLPLISHFRNL